MIELQAVTEMKAIDLIKNFQRDFRVIDHSINFIFGYSQQASQLETEEEQK